MPTTYSPERYEALVEKTFEEIQSLARNKGREYSGTEDRLRNFRNIARDIGINKETVLYTYMKKHWDSLTTWVKDQEAGNDVHLTEPIEGRIHDLIVYLLLLRAMVDERDRPATPEEVQDALRSQEVKEDFGTKEVKTTLTSEQVDDLIRKAREA